ncbi:MAG: hypothetical protein JW945_02210 [Methanomicrobia archaeon]|nr:hypothetical protein [Methanomicrobia archaeon]
MKDIYVKDKFEKIAGISIVIFAHYINKMRDIIYAEDKGMKIAGISIVIFALFALSYSPVAATNQVYLIPQQSNASYCNNADVEIWANATGFAGGRINLTYNPTCSNVTNWVTNSTNFPNSDSVYYNGRITIDFYRTGGTYTGTYMIGTLTIHCVNNSQGGCETPLTFVLPTSLRDDIGNTVPATWKNGTFTCGELQQCLGTCCNNTACTEVYAYNMPCQECLDLNNKYWKPNKDSACFNGDPMSDLCLKWCPQCCNGADDEPTPDGKIDFSADKQCTCGLDPSEAYPAAPVPELPTIALFGIGLLALTGYVLRKRS